jgi:serine/threonine protein kinase
MNSDVDKSLPTDSVSSNEAEALSPEAAQQFTGDITTLPVNVSPPAPASYPSTVGKYTILEEGQAGGMGIVYKARDGELDRIVALKVIKGGVLAREEEIARFHREARAVARLNHPNIISVYEIGQERGCPYFTMAFAWGGSLAQRRERFADPRLAAALLETIARAVHHAHERGILHRDLKPANILFDENDSPLVSDFSLAKFTDSSQELTQSGALLGTPSYMAPEQASGHSEQIAVQTDVWALGVMLYELLTGRQPFKGTNHEELLRKVRTTEPQRPRSVNRYLDRALETVVLKCLEKEPSRRYASAEALADDLARWLRGEPVLARPPSWQMQAGRSMRRLRRPAFQLGAVVVLFPLLWLAWRGSSPAVLSEKTSEEKLPKEMAQLLERLQKGEKVTLIGKSGAPPAQRWLPNKFGTLRPRTKIDDPFCIIGGTSASMLELLPATPKSFRVRAQVQHLESIDQEDMPRGYVGIYFDHRAHLEGESRTDGFFRLAFNDRTATAPIQKNALPQSKLGLNFVFHQKQGKDLPIQQIFDGEVYQPFVPAGKANPMPWRSLMVEVSPEQIRTFWEGQLVKSFLKKTGANGAVENEVGCDPRRILQRAALQTGHREFLPQPRPDTGTALSGGLGFYVQQGVAAFRYVEIKPLP